MASHDPQSPVEALLHALDAGAIPRASVALDAVDVDELVAAATTDLAPRLRDIPSEVTAEDPRLLLLRTLARMYRFDGSEPELGTRALTALVALLEAERWSDDDARWAGHAAMAWTLWSLAWNEAQGCLPHARNLVARHADRVTDTPLLAAALGAIGSVASDAPLAGPLWLAALEGPAASRNGDDWWSIRTLHACLELLGRAPDPRHAIVDLRRARDHFADRPSTFHERWFHDAASHLVVALTLLGDTEEAQGELDVALVHATPGGSVEAHLAALQPLILLRAGNVDAAAVANRDISPMVAAGHAWQCEIGGPIDLAIAAARGDRAQVARRMAQLRVDELTGASMVGYRVLWRIAAAEAASEVGLAPEAQQLLAEVSELLADHPLPLYRCWEECVRIAHGLTADLEVSAHLAVELAGRYGLEGMLSRGVASTGGVLAAERVRRSGTGGAAQLSASTILTLAGRQIDGVEDRSVRVQVLGDCRVWIGGSEVPTGAWNGRKQARLVMAALLVPPRSARHRDEVADLIWGEIAPESIGPRMRPLIHTVRSVLQAGTGSEDGARYLVSSAGHLRLCLAADDWCDAHEFLDCVDACIDPTAGSEPAIAAGFRALDLYAGPYMAGQGFEDIVTATRDWLHDQAIAVALRLSELLEPGSADAHRVLAWLQRAYGEESLRSELCAGIDRLSGAAAEGHAS